MPNNTDWKKQLHPASFRGVPFQVENEEGTFGRRVQVHEYPHRNQPYTEDMGRATRRFNISAWLVGEEVWTARDQLIIAIDTPGPGMLVHPYYGEIRVCVDGQVRVSHNGSEGRVCRVHFSVVEAGERRFPTTEVATSHQLQASNATLNDQITRRFSGIGLKGLPDFTQQSLLSRAQGWIEHLTQVFDQVDRGMAAASRFLEGDMSVLLQTGQKSFLEALQRLWRSGRRTATDARHLAHQINTLAGVTLGHDLAPRAVWRSDRPSRQRHRQHQNTLSAMVRMTAIHEAVHRVTLLPAPGGSSWSSASSSLSPTSKPFQPNRASSMTRSHSAERSKFPRVSPAIRSHPALHSAPVSMPPVVTLTFDTLVTLRDRLHQAIEKEQRVTMEDGLFLALSEVKAALHRDMTLRLAQVEKTVFRTPLTVLPAVVLASQWYDDAQRAGDILSRNVIPHPGFVPLRPLRVPMR